MLNGDGQASSERLATRVLWTKSEVAFTHLLVASRLLRGLLRKYRPDQPRVPAGRQGGGRWTRVGEAVGASLRDHLTGLVTGVLQSVFTSVSGAAP